MIRVLLATLTAGNVSAHFCSSLADLLSKPITGVRVDHLLVHGGPQVAHQRNMAVKHFLETSNDYLLFVDSDIRFEPRDIDLLLDSNKDIVGARYYGYSEARDEPFPTWKPIEPKESGLIECSHIGTGCILIRRKVLEKMPTPFGFDIIDGCATTDDVTFCHRATDAGFKVFLNADARVYHMKSRLV